MKVRRFKKKAIKFSYKNNRINIVLAIIFLLGGLSIYKLYDIQIRKCDLYTALASSQHKIFNKLAPDRGEIFMVDNGVNPDEREIYPLATNKNFALVYSVPLDVEDPVFVAESFFEVFDKQEVEEEVDKIIKEEEENKIKVEFDYIKSLNLEPDEKKIREEEVIAKFERIRSQESYKEEIESKRKFEIDLRKEKILEEYEETLKLDDPYEPIAKKVDEEHLKKMYSLLLSREKEVKPEDLEIKGEDVLLGGEKIKFPGVAYAMSRYRYYPEGEIGSQFLGYVSNNVDDLKGHYGLEGFFDTQLAGEYGSVKTEKGAGAIMIINDREYIKPKSGDSLILSINRSIQFEVCKKLKNSVGLYGADSGTVIIAEPNTGEILAMCSYPSFNPNNYNEVEDISIYNNPTVFDQYEPGSVFKTITMAAALDKEAVKPSTAYEDKGQIMIDSWPKPISNSDYDTVGAHGMVDMNYVLEYSLNTGAIWAMKQVGTDDFADYIKDFGFGERTGIELESESPGDIRNISGDHVGEIYAATASFGQGLTVTPLQMLMSYVAIANGGNLMKPYIVKEIIKEDGTVEVTRPIKIRRVISERTSALLSGMLVNVVEGGHAILAAVDGYYVGGKTGTAQVASSNARGYSNQTIHNFIGFAPIEEPKFVMLVKLDNPKNVKYSASSAAPLFGEIADFVLKYYKTPKER